MSKKVKDLKRDILVVIENLYDGIPHEGSVAAFAVSFNDFPALPERSKDDENGGWHLTNCNIESDNKYYGGWSVVYEYCLNK